MQEKVGLPVREFFYTTDQIAYLIDCNEDYLKRSLLHYQGRSVGVCPKDKLLATNIGAEGDAPNWRVAETHLKRWMRFKGIKVYDRGYVK